MASLTAQRVIELLLAVIPRERKSVDTDYLIGPVHPLPTREPSNWAVVPGGDPGQRAVILKAVAAVRRSHPRISVVTTTRSRYAWRPPRRLLG